MRFHKILKTRIYIMLLIIIGLPCSGELYSQSNLVDVNAIIRRVDELMFPDAKISAVMYSTNKNEVIEKYGMDFYTKDRNQKIIVRFTSPASQIGNDLLMIETNVWAFDNRSKRIMKMPSNQSFGGSGFSYGDVVRLNFSDNYTATLNEERDAEWIIDLTARTRNAPYHRIVLSVDKSGNWPIEGTCYSKSGTIVKNMYYSEIGDAGNGEKPLLLTVVSPSAPNEKTMMMLISEEPKILPDRIFNKRNLELRLEEKF